LRAQFAGHPVGVVRGRQPLKLADKSTSPGSQAHWQPFHRWRRTGAIKLPSSVVHSEWGGRAVTARRVLPLVAMLVSVPFAAGAQHEGAPGDGFGVPPAGPPPGCQELTALRNEIQKHWWAIKRAHERNASVHEACPLFKSYLATETKLINSLVEH